MKDYIQPYLPLEDYVIVRDGNPLATQIANRHYSRLWKGNVNQNRFCPPGKRLILLEPSGSWLFAWNQEKYRRDGQTGVCCVLFRNESDRLSSEIILQAEKAWDSRYGVTRKFTYVHPGKIRSTNPGCCFKSAGWERYGVSKRGLILLVKGEPGSYQITQPEEWKIPGGVA